MSDQLIVAVFGSQETAQGGPEWEEARDTGFRLAKAGFTVMTGGYGGTMEAASKGAAEAGGHVIGVTSPSLFRNREGANPYVREEIEAATLSERLGVLIGRASGVIALPGSIGTATELMMAWNINHVARRNGGTRIPCVAVGEAWRSVAAVLVESIEAMSTDIHHAANGAQAVDWIVGEIENR